MRTFLNTVAEDLVKIANTHYNGRLNEITVIFPNKRASLFFNQELMKYVCPPFWAPHYCTITELFQSLSTLTIADPVLLIYYLYKAYKSVTGSQETFDQFYSWGEVLLNDFEDIDNNMVDASKLFINITDIEELTGFQYIDKEQEQAIRKLFNSFSTETTTQLHERYLKMWKAMPDIYKEFKHLLHQQNYAYAGMLKREVAETIKGGKVTEHTEHILYNKCRHSCIVGFNVLNETEKILFRYVQEAYDAYFYWDYDEVYKDNPAFEAGSFISENIKLFGNRLNTPDNYRNLHKKKDIQFVASATDSAQCRYAGQWLEQRLVNDTQLNRTAIVLCDEQILQPMLHSIPATYGSNKPTLLNITMGYPMQETPIAGFVISVLELIFRGWRSKTNKSQTGKWRYTYVDKVLKHPYTMMMNKDDALSIIANFKRNNTTYPSQNELKGYFIEDIFKEPADDITGNIRHVAELVKAIAVKLSNHNNSIDTLYAESIFNTWTILNRFQDLMENHGLEFDTPETLIRLIRQAISAGTVAFHGEPAVGVQMMGILETRNLDFENVIMLSVNEGMLPKSGHSTSFILNFLREAYGMTTQKRQTSLYAYYFYRLIQRARHVTLVYNNATEGLNRGEMSRFMMQLKYEKDSILSDETTIQEHTLSPDMLPDIKTTIQQQECTTMQYGSISVSKSKAKVFNTLNKIARLSPSALNTYLDCQLRFYLQYVCGFHEEDEISENVADNVFGSIFHRSMEYFYSGYKEQTLDADFFNRYVQKDANGKYTITKNGNYDIRRCVDKGFAEEMFKVPKDDVMNDRFTLELNGTQLLNHEVIARYVEKQIINDSQVSPLIILEQETPHYTDFSFTSGGVNRKIKIGGIIDREDIVTIDGTKRHRIVDYKTSSRQQATASIDDLFIPNDKRSGYIFQAFYYCEVIMDELTSKNTDKEIPILAPTLLYIKLSQKPQESFIKVGKDFITDYKSQCHDEFNRRLEQLLADIFDTNKDFFPASSDYACKFCPFKAICNKENKETTWK